MAIDDPDKKVRKPLTGGKLNARKPVGKF